MRSMLVSQKRALMVRSRALTCDGKPYLQFDDTRQEGL